MFTVFIRQEIQQSLQASVGHGLDVGRAPVYRLNGGCDERLVARRNVSLELSEDHGNGPLRRQVGQYLELQYLDVCRVAGSHEERLQERFEHALKATK